MNTEHSPPIVVPRVALTISQPFASLIANGEKWVENRRWPTRFRGLLAIHAGKGTQYLDREELAEYPTGCIVAVSRLAACVELEARDMTEAHVQIYGTTKTVADFLRHEHTEGPWCFIIEDVRRLETPVECRGAQGLWNVPPEIAARLH